MESTTPHQPDALTLKHYYEDLLWTDQEIDKHFGLSVSRTAKLRKRWGIPTIRRYARTARQKGLAEPTPELFRHLYLEERQTTHGIAAMSGIGASTVRRLLAEWGIEVIQDRLESYVGKRFGRLVVLAETRGVKGEYQRQCHCLCDCGEKTTVLRPNLDTGATTSCGCYKVESQSLQPGLAARNQVIGQYKFSARRRNLAYAISNDEMDIFLLNRCHYCNAPPSRTKSTPAGSFIYNGIDRVDNDRGYVMGNVVTCCADCNYAKRLLSYDDFITHVHLIRAKPTMWPGKKSPRRYHYATTRNGARGRNLPFALSRGQVKELIRQPCTYCGMDPACGIDRTDSSLGYTAENSVPACTDCNRMKMTRSVKVFLQWAAAVQAHRSISTT